MDEETQKPEQKTEEKAEENQPESKSENTNDRVSNSEATETGGSEEPDMIAKANSAADRLKEENDRKEKLLAKEEKLAADAIASGRGRIVSRPTPRSAEEQTSRDKIIAYGKSTGAAWADEMEKADAR